MALDYRHCENCKYGRRRKRIAELVCGNFEYRLLFPDVKRYSPILNPKGECENYERTWWKIWATK